MNNDTNDGEGTETITIWCKDIAEIYVGLPFHAKAIPTNVDVRVFHVLSRIFVKNWGRYGDSMLSRRTLVTKRDQQR